MNNDRYNVIDLKGDINLKIIKNNYPVMLSDEFVDQLNQYEKSLIRSFDRCFSPMMPKERLFLGDWMDEHYNKPMEEGAGQAWKTRNMQRGIMVAICHTDVEKIFFKKMSQFGGTTFATAAQCYFNVEYDYNTCYYLPNDPEAKEHSKSKWSTMIRDIPKLNDALLAPNVESQHKKNLDTFKMFSTSSAYCRGAISTSRFQRITLHFVVLDEIDRMGSNIGGEGSALGLVEGRFRENGFGKVFVLGTPTRFGSSQIHDHCNKCKHLFEWHAPCPKCGVKQVMEWGSDKVPHGIKWDKSLKDIDDQANSVHYVCKHCQDSFTHKEFKLVCDEGGVWICEGDGSWIDTKNNCFRDRFDQVINKAPSEVAFVPSPDCSGLLSNGSWEKGLSDFLKAVKSAKAGKNYDLVTWFNTYAGQVFREESQKESDPNDLLLRREDYYDTIPDNLNSRIERLTMGVDFQDRFCKYQIDGHGLDGEQWALRCERIEGRTDDKKADMWDILDEVANETYRTEDGRKLKIDVVIADVGYRPKYILRWCGRNPDQRIAVKGDGRRVDMPMFEPNWEKDFSTKFNCWYVNINPHLASKLLYRKLSTPYPDPNDGPQDFTDYYHHPISDKFNIDYFGELTADKEQYRKVGNDYASRYEKLHKNVPNEAHDISKYMFIALEVLELTGREITSSKASMFMPDDISDSEYDEPYSEYDDLASSYEEKIYGHIKSGAQHAQHGQDISNDQGFASIYARG